MSTIKSSTEHLTLNADGSGKDIKFQANGVEKASISSAGAFTSTSIDATKLSGTVPNFTSTGIDDNATSTAITITSDGRGLSQFTAKAWCHYEDDGGSDFNSHNISSITVVSTGKYTANFTNSMANTLYSAVVFNEDGSAYNDAFYAGHDTADARSVSQYGFWTGDLTPNNANSFNLMVFGD
jgi:hypothetical protein